jgi:hypothetical protein
VDEVTVETGSESSALVNAPEGFESGIGSWTIDHGVWQIGVPTNGTVKAFAGTNCAGTVLNGIYPPGADSRLISPEFTVPAVTDQPRLRFWHWFSMFPGDFGQVEINAGTGGWQPLSPQFSYNSFAWTRPWFDLTPYAGQNVQIAFHFQADLDNNVGLGWYIDEVEVETGPTAWDPTNQAEGFESGLGNWSVDNGVWETGTPAFLLTKAFDGSNCAGTVLAGPYPPHADSRLISPPFTVPPASQSPRLRFWHWLLNKTGDPATVEIRPAGGSWQALSGPMVARDASWARPYFALDQFGGQQVQIAFHFQSNDDSDTDAGWFVDDVTVETGPIRANFINQPETFENGLGDWSVDLGTWQIGTPTNYPSAAHSGTLCVGTVIGGSYSPSVDSRLISPPFVVPTDNPRLRFWHWFSMWPGDFGTVEISAAGGPWQALSPPVTLNGVVWTRPSYDLGAFAGQTVRIAFRFQSNADNDVGVGWYIDDVEVDTGPTDLQSFSVSEGFESGLGNWSVDNGVWVVGQPSWGPGAAFKGTNCAATVLQFGVYYWPDTDARLISPFFTVPCAEAGPRLRFAQWYDIEPGDEGSVEVRVQGGDWQPVLSGITGSSHDWTTGFYDLSPFAGQRIQIAFHFQSNDDNLVSTGWYIDEVKIQASLLPPLDPTSIPEGTLFTYSFGSPCQNLRFSLGPGAPAGVSIDPTLGILAWLPTEDQGPGNYPIQICVSDAAQPATPIDCITFQVAVQEVNSPPVLDPIGPQTISAGVPIQFTATATDPDLPKQNLTFSLDQGAPFGASIDPHTGFFTWTPTPTQATTQYTITVRVTDDGNPPLSATSSFTATPGGPVTAARLQVTISGPGQVTVCMEGGTLGSMYSLEATTDLNPSANPDGWITLQSVWKGDEPYCATTTSGTSPIRFYRIRLLQ